MVDINHSDNDGYQNIWIAIVLSLLTSVLGLTYLVLQVSFIQDNEMKDPIFVAFMTGATAFLAFERTRVLDYMVTKGADFYSFIIGSVDPNKSMSDNEELRSSVMNRKNIVRFSLLWALLISATPFIAGIWSEDPIIQIMLSLFLFVANIVCGAAFYSLIMFLLHSIKMQNDIKVELWNSGNDSIVYFMSLVRRVALTASVYVAAVMFAMFNGLYDPLYIYILSVFNIVVLLLTYITPVFLIAKKINKEKQDRLHDIDLKITQAFKNDISNNLSNNKIKVDSFQELLQVRETITDVSILPFRTKVIATSSSIFLLTFLPVLLEVILTN